jgi:hypothetical protein
MKKLLLVTALMLATSPAYAWVKVTNMSGKPQSVTIESAGSRMSQNIAPGVTENLLITDGMISLNDPATIAQAQRAEPGVGGKIFGDMIASNRTSRIPASHGETYVIWPDGRILLQTRKGRSGWSF